MLARRKVKIAAVHSKKAYTTGTLEEARKIKEENINKMCCFLEEAGKQGADIVSTPECFEGISMDNYKKNELKYKNLIEEIPGSIFERIAAIAKKYNMNIVANYHEKDSDEIYNTSILVDRKGKLVGRYRKVHLPPRERWIVIPGSEFTVLESDVGNVGFATCYDIMFPEHCRAMALNGADIIFHQTEGWGTKTLIDIGELLVRTRAAENYVYLVISKNIQKVNERYAKSCVINNKGQILVEAGGEEEKVIVAEVEPDFDCTDKESYNTLFSGIEKVRARDLLERRPLLYKILTNEEVPLKERYKNVKLPETIEEIKEIYDKWKKYEGDIRNNIPVNIRYHW